MIGRAPAEITRHVVGVALAARRVSARFGRTPAANDTERSTLVDQLRPGTRALLTSDAFIGTLDVVVLESSPSRIDLIDDSQMGHALVRRAEGWRLRRYECVDVRFEVEILCAAPALLDPSDAYAMILEQALDDEDLSDQLSGYAFELAKQATGLVRAGKVSGDVDDDRVCVAVVLRVGDALTHVLVNTKTGDAHVAVEVVL